MENIEKKRLKRQNTQLQRYGAKTTSFWPFWVQNDVILELHKALFFSKKKNLRYTLNDVVLASLVQINIVLDK